MNDWVNDWVNDWMKDWVNDWVNDGVNVWEIIGKIAFLWLYERMFEWVFK